MSIFTPTNQIRLTNVAIIRYKRKGKRFELACYPNKVNDWKDGLEPKISEVLQIDEIFVNVSKGEIAKGAVLHECFDTEDKEVIVPMILEKGRQQLGKKERELKLSNLFKDIASIIAEKCVNPATKRPVTQKFAVKAMKEAHINVKLYKTAKQQALKVIQQLVKAGHKISRAEMRLKLTAAVSVGKKLMGHLREVDLISSIEEEDWETEMVVTCLISPGDYRALEEAVTKYTKGEGKVEVLSLAVVEDTEASIDDVAAGADSEEEEEAKEEKPEVQPKKKGKRRGKKKTSKFVPAEETSRGQAPPSLDDLGADEDAMPSGMVSKKKKKKNRGKRAPVQPRKKGGQAPPGALDSDDEAPAPTKGKGKGKGKGKKKGGQGPPAGLDEPAKKGKGKKKGGQGPPGGLEPAKKGRGKKKGGQGPPGALDSDEGESVPVKKGKKGKRRGK